MFAEAESPVEPFCTCAFIPPSALFVCLSVRAELCHLRLCSVVAGGTDRLEASVCATATMFVLSKVPEPIGFFILPILGKYLWLSVSVGVP